MREDQDLEQGPGSVRLDIAVSEPEDGHSFVDGEAFGKGLRSSTSKIIVIEFEDLDGRASLRMHNS